MILTPKLLGSPGVGNEWDDDNPALAEAGVFSEMIRMLANMSWTLSRLNDLCQERAAACCNDSMAFVPTFA